ncbi:MAG TPA: gamma-glutamyltransferase, partial [Candidatus Latescibacteria bacterium]|nr:gamma-glutamyltransferase [Candidatus Latescibacterota bacterium]
APAIEYAEGGFPLTVKNSMFFRGSTNDLRLYPSSASTYLIDGASPEPGQILVQDDLAETFRTIASEGAEAFYRGAIADVMAAFMADTGGLLTKKDLTNFEPVWLDPAEVEYRGHRVYAPAPPCQAVQYMETLAILNGFDIGGMGHNTAETLHTFIEAAKLACIDRIHYTAIDNPPTEGLLSPDYAATR